MDISESIAKLKTFDMDHLGIVAGIVDDIGLVEEIDRELGTHEQEVLSPGVVVKAMILNGLGFVSAPLYLFEEFFVGKPTEHLLGAGIRPEHLNDDKLGRVLDKLYEADVTKLFVNIALKAVKRYGVALETIHLDASSFHVHGEYEGEAREELAEELPVIHLTYGYSREQRPDLKQFVLDLMCSHDGDVPCFFRAADGNESDKQVFAELIRDYQAQLDLDALFVADSALYSQENLQTLQGLSWFTRVPQTLKQAKELLAEVNVCEQQPARLPDR
jgi:transposase